MRRALLVSAAITFAIACTDNITEPVPDRPDVTAGAARANPTVAFATTTTEDGLSISTDKDDYQPGDVVHLTGSGWPASDVLSIRLDDEPATHHRTLGRSLSTRTAPSTTRLMWSTWEILA